MQSAPHSQHLSGAAGQTGLVSSRQFSDDKLRAESGPPDAEQGPTGGRWRGLGPYRGAGWRLLELQTWRLLELSALGPVTEQAGCEEMGSQWEGLKCRHNLWV